MHIVKTHWYHFILPSVTTYTNGVNSNPVEARCIQYNIMWQFVNDLRQVGSFLRVLWFSPSIKPTATV